MSAKPLDMADRTRRLRGMTGYTKLFGSILASTIWREDDKTRLVWITLLAMVNRNGIAEGSIPGLADMARVSIEDCEAALAKLQSPDKYSRSQEHEGRRITPVDGGWLVLNYAKYRDRMNKDDRREYNRLKQAEVRLRNLSANVSKCQTPSALSAQAEATATSEAEAEAEAPTSSPSGDAGGNLILESEQSDIKDYTYQALEIYQLYPRKVGKLAAIGSIRRALAKLPAVALREKTKAFADAVSRWPTGSEQFIPHPATWFNQGRYDDDPKTWERIAPTNGQQDKSRLARELLDRIKSAEAYLARVSDEIRRIPIDTPEKAQKRAEINAAQRKLDDLRREHALL